MSDFGSIMESLRREPGGESNSALAMIFTSSNLTLYPAGLQTDLLRARWFGCRMQENPLQDARGPGADLGAQGGINRDFPVIPAVRAQARVSRHDFG